MINRNLKPGQRATSSGSTENWPLLLQPSPHVTGYNVACKACPMSDLHDLHKSFEPFTDDPEA